MDCLKCFICGEPATKTFSSQPACDKCEGFFNAVENLTKKEAYAAGVSAAADIKKGIESNPWKDYKTKQEKDLRDEFNRGYREQMGFYVWAKGLE